MEVKCKWLNDEICCNSNNKEMIADYCDKQIEKCEYMEERNERNDI